MGIKLLFGIFNHYGQRNYKFVWISVQIKTPIVITNLNLTNNPDVKYNGKVLICPLLNFLNLEESN